MSACWWASTALCIQCMLVNDCSIACANARWRMQWCNVHRLTCWQMHMQHISWFSDAQVHAMCAHMNWIEHMTKVHTCELMLAVFKQRCPSNAEDEWRMCTSWMMCDVHAHTHLGVLMKLASVQPHTANLKTHSVDVSTCVNDDTHWLIMTLSNEKCYSAVHCFMHLAHENANVLMSYWSCGCNQTSWTFWKCEWKKLCVCGESTTCKIKRMCIKIFGQDA